MSRSVSHLKIVPKQADIYHIPAHNRLSIGRVLLSRNWVTEGDLLKANSLQRYEDAPIGEILIGLGKITADQLYWALAKLHNLELLDFKDRPPSTNWTDFSDPQTSLKLGYLVWRNTKHTLTIALTDPNKMEMLGEIHNRVGQAIDFVLVKPSCLHKYIAENQRQLLSDSALSYCPKPMSCQSWTHWTTSKIWGVFIFAAATAAAYFAPEILLSTALVLVFIALILLMGLRLCCLYALYGHDDPLLTSVRLEKTTKRPKVSILVPLYREAAILSRLFERLQVLAYPKELLEICFIYEENDQSTKDALISLNLPWYMKSIEVPSGQLQTKPRAMNYALDFCTGSIIGIYDAEDAPEANQIERVIQKFARSDENIACIQCVLDFYNANTNWISRCFTIEYAIQFRLILPALDRLKLPIPLGGTSVFFRREILEKLGRWDAYNVTEDADLGYRLYRMGYRCCWINTVTYEEANYRMIPWIKQRSRWLKGFLLTLLVHFKNPLKLKKEVGTKAALSMLSLSVVPWIVCPLVPVVLPMWLLSAGYDLPLYSKLPSWFMTPLIISFIATEIMSVLLGYIATKSDQHKHLRPWLLTMLLYWPIALFASCKALYEVFVRPVYWDKSEHGVNDQNYALEIKELTRNSGHDTG